MLTTVPTVKRTTRIVTAVVAVAVPLSAKPLHLANRVQAENATIETPHTNYTNCAKRAREREKERKRSEVRDLFVYSTTLINNFTRLTLRKMLWQVPAETE
jgi:hypothetical protein